MKLGTVVWTKETDLGIYLYPHSRPVQSNTVCSVLSKADELIYHIPYNAIKSYRNLCWNCHALVNSEVNATCSVCHWVKCPVCDTCRRPGCSPDSLQILDQSDPSNWEEVIGIDMDSFFDLFENDKYECLEKENIVKIESYCEAMIKNQLHPLLIINSLGVVSLYVEVGSLGKAKEIICFIDSNIDETDIISDFYGCSGVCVFCGEPTDGDMLCAMCANNID